MRPLTAKLFTPKVTMRLALISTLLIMTSCRSPQPDTPSAEPAGQSSHALHCGSVSGLQGKVVGDGQCVSLIKQCSGAPHTSQWRPGKQVLGKHIKGGSIIATFQNGRYPNKHGHHAAIYINQDANGIWVWDQWLGKPVHRRLIRIRHDNADPGNTAQAYRLVRIANQ